MATASHALATDATLETLAKDTTLGSTNTALGVIASAIAALPNATQTAADNANAAAAAANNAVAKLDGRIDGTNDRVGLFSATLTANSLYPYYDYTVNGAAGDTFILSLNSYSGDMTKITRWYLLDPDTNTTLKTPLPIGRRYSITLSSAVQTFRFIFQVSEAPASLIDVTIECYKVGDRTCLDAAENMVYQSEVNITEGVALNVSHLPFMGKAGDVFEFEVIDPNDIRPVISVGFLYNNEAVDNVINLGRPFTKGTAKLGVDVDMDSLRLYSAAANVEHTGKFYIRYKNITKIGAPIKTKRYNSFSILGDSYSTYKGYTNPAENTQWYPTNDSSTQGYNTGNNVTDLAYMWWYIIGDETDLYMKKNASFSGSTICYDSYGSGGADGKETSFIQRMGDIEESSVLFVFGGTNDYWAGASLGDYKYSGWEEADLSYFNPALAYLIYNLKRTYIGIDIVFIENDALSADYKTAIETVCAHYNVPVIKLDNISKTYSHPNIIGMRQIANYIKIYLGQAQSYPFYE